jgi:hypothetical protein
MNPAPQPAPQVSPLWQAAYRQAAAIPSSLSPDQVKRRAAIHAYWQMVLRAIREERS